MPGFFKWAKIVILLILLGCHFLWAQNSGIKKSSLNNKTEKVTTIIVVRHAEKKKGENPSLSEKGKVRALALKEALKASDISAIYCPNLKRNKQTAQPLADFFHIDLTLISEDLYTQPKKMAEHVAYDILTKHAGKTILYVGNTTKHIEYQGSNLNEMYWRLGGEGMNLTRYQDMYIFIVRPHSTQMIHTFYGNID